ncbi:MAG: hypothetical protein DMF70_06880 [Acidobacteria bacterium]|nr:MAG: hypothetical protein DMF70_06880 [Acidobacteriota bacterium]
MRHRATLALLFAFALAVYGATRLQAQPRPGTSAQETDDEVKVNTYKKFVENREPNPALAYEGKTISTRATSRSGYPRLRMTSARES